MKEENCTSRILRHAAEAVTRHPVLVFSIVMSIMLLAMFMSQCTAETLLAAAIIPGVAGGKHVAVTESDVNDYPVWNLERVSGDAETAEDVYAFKDAMDALSAGEEEDAEVIFNVVDLSGPNASKGGYRFDLDCQYQTEQEE